MIDINLTDMIAAAKQAEEDEAEKIAFKDIPGPPIKGEAEIARPEAEGKDSPGGETERGD